MVLSIVVLTGYAGQISLAQWALAGIGALIAGRFVHAGLPIELAILLGVLLTIPVGLDLRGAGAAHPRREPRGGHARPRLPRVRGRVRQPQLPRRRARRRHPDRRGEAVRAQGRRVQPPARVGGGQPRRVRAPRAARRQPASIAHRPPPHRRAHQRAGRRVARHLGVRREALRVRGVGRRSPPWPASWSASAARSSPTPTSTSSRRSTASATPSSAASATCSARCSAAPNAVGGIGTRIIDDWIGLSDRWDLIIGSVLVFVILIVHQNGIADVVDPRPAVLGEAPPGRPAARSARRSRPPRSSRSPGATLSISGLTVRFGSVVAVDDVSLEVQPGRGRRPDRAERRGQDDAHRRGDRLRARQPAARSRSTADRIEGLNATKRARLGAAPLVPVARAVRGHQRRGEHPGRAATMRASRAVVGDRPVLARPPRPAADRRRRGARVRPRSRTSTRPPRSSPTAGAGWSASPAPSRPDRRS